MLELDYPSPVLEQLRNTPVEPYLAVLMRVARVNEVCVAERNLAVSLGLTLGASEEATIVALQLADSDRTLADLVADLPASLRLVLYRDACRMAWADCQLDDGETAFLDGLAVTLGLSAERCHPIRELVGHIARAQASLLRQLA